MRLKPFEQGSQTNLGHFFFPASAHWPVWPGQSTGLSRKRERSCTGPFNWGGAHCAGENVKQRTEPFLQKSLEKQTQTKPQQNGHSPPRQPETPRPFFLLERHLAQVAWSLSVLSLSQCTTSRLAPWTRGESNRG